MEDLRGLNATNVPASRPTTMNPQLEGFSRPIIVSENTGTSAVRRLRALVLLYISLHDAAQIYSRAIAM
jgi:hypothetical protein